MMSVTIRANKRSLKKGYYYKYTVKYFIRSQFTKVILENDGWSTDQVIKPVYLNSLKSWIGKIDYDSFKIKADIDIFLFI